MPDSAPTSSSSSSQPSDRTHGSGVASWLQLVTGYTWRLLVLGVGIVVLFMVMAKLLVVTLPTVIAIILATLCMPAKRALAARGLNDLWATVVVVIGGLIAFIALFAALAPAFVSQLRELGPTVVQGWDDFLEWVHQGPFGIDPAQVDAIVKSITDAFSGGGGASNDILSGVVSGVSTVGQFLAGLVLMIVLLFFVVKDASQITDWCQSRVPVDHRATVSALGARAWGALSGYVRGTATIALIDAVGIGIGLAIVGVPLVFPLAVLVFFGGFLPVIGAALAGLVAVLVALADGGITKALLVLALILVVQQVEGNFLQPTIMRKAVALHPMVVLTALAAGGSLGGIIGAFLAVPIVAVLAAVGNEMRLRSQAGLLSAGTQASAEPIGGPKVDEESALASIRATAAERAKQRRQSGQD